MPWVRFDDDWYDDEELSNAHPLSVLLWATAISWSARNLTDGLVPSGRIDMLVNWRRAGVPDPQPFVDELTELGKLEPVPSGFQIANYLTYQPSRADVLAKREAEAERKRVRRASSGTPAGRGEESRAGPAHPDPVPEGSPTSICPDVLRVAAPQAVDGSADEGVPAGAWSAYARHQRAKSKTEIRDTSRYDDRTIRNGRNDLELVEKAKRWWLEFDITTEELGAAMAIGEARSGWMRRRVAG